MIPLYYYPSRTLFLEGRRHFVRNLLSRLDSALFHVYFHSGQEALHYLSQLSNKSLVGDRALTEHEDSQSDPLLVQTVTLDVSEIQQTAFNKNRFNEISVLVIEEKPRGIDTITFLQKIKHLPAKKLFLSGNSKLALKLFNQNLIDHFINKRSFNLPKLLQRAIGQLHYDYFQTVSTVVGKLLTLNSCAFLRDSKFIAFFEDFQVTHQIVEFYVTETTGSLLLLDKFAKSRLLLVRQYGDFGLYYDLALHSGAPSEVLEALRSAAVIPYLSDPRGYYQLTGHQWHTILYPAQELTTKDTTYYYAFVDDLDRFERTEAMIYSYDSHLKVLAKEA